MDRKIVIPLHVLLDTREAPTVLVDENYRIVAANRAYCESYGVTQEQVVGRTCHEVSHRSPVPCHEHGEQCPHREVFGEGRPSDVLHAHTDFDNRLDYVRIKSYPIHDAEGRRYMMESLQRLAQHAELNVDAYRLAGRSPAFVRFFAELASAAKAGVTVWLHGEAGTGKALAARFIHENSARARAAFVSFDCAAHPPGQCESELFGQIPGNRGSLYPPRQGVFEMAAGGTLFLDEFDALPLALQGKLLRLLDSRDGPAYADAATRMPDVRLIVASRRDLEEMMAEGQFRQDLYYRVSGFRIGVPPLRERREDIPLIAESMLIQIARESGLVCRLTQAATEALSAHAFPGNMRELHALLLGAATRCREGVIDAGDLALDPAPAVSGDGTRTRPRKRSAATAGDGGRLPNAGGDLPPDGAGSQAEAEHIRALLKRYGSRRIVAKKLGISVPVLYRRLKALGIINIGLAAVSMLLVLHGTGS
ncbi:MAG: sigma 54-interacting transcriptional regulator [Pseudomonadota bacterium]